MSKSSRLAKALLLAGTTLVCLLLAEITLRVVRPEQENIYEIDERYLHRLVPGASKVFVRDSRNGGGRVPVRINSEGFRGPELRLAGAARRVVVYGDSFVEAEFSPLEETFTEYLGRNLREATHAPVEVVNAGVVAYGPDQVSLRIEDEADRLKPDLLVVAIYAGNDYGDLLRDKLFRLDASGALVQNHITIHPALREQFAHRARLRLVSDSVLAYENIAAHLKGTLPDEEAEKATYVARAARTCRAQYEETVVRGDMEVKNLFGDDYDADIALGTDAEAANYKIRLMEQVLLRIKRTLDASSVPLALVVIPAVIDVSPNYGVIVDKDRYPLYDPAALTRAVQDIAARNGIACLDLFDPFRAADASRLYFKYPDAHWNAQGQHLAAELLTKMIVSHNLLRERNTP